LAEFKTNYRKNPNLADYPRQDYETSLKFANKCYKEFGKFVKAIVLFGRSARREPTHGKKQGDIDVLVIIDDVSIIITEDLIGAYRVITEKIVNDVSDRLHITTLKLSSFWEYVRSGDPIAINMLREGVPLLDTGFFDPLQLLLHQGRIRPTAESVWSYFVRAPATLHNSRWHIMQATLDLYWAVIDASHAALMKLGEIPPTPEHAADMLKAKMVKRGLLPSKYVKIMREFYDISRKITHREIQYITSDQYNYYYRRAKEFVDKIKDFIEKPSKLDKDIK